MREPEQSPGGVSILLKRLPSFINAQIFSVSTPLVALPLIATAASHREWVTLGIGQSAGSVLAMMAAYGANLSGSQELARAPHAERPAVVLSHLRVQAVILATVLPAAFATMWFTLESQDLPLAFLSMLSFAISGFSLGWYSAGIGTTSPALKYEILPRTLATIVAAIGIGAGLPIEAYPASVAAVGLVGAAWFMRDVHRDWTEDRRGTLLSLRRHLRQNFVAASSELLQGAYLAGSVALACSLITLRDAAAYTSADRMFRLLSVGVVVIGGLSVGWVAEAAVGVEWRRRARTAVVLHAALGGAGGLAFALLAPLASTALFGPDLGVPMSLAIPFGVAFSLLTVNSGLLRTAVSPSDAGRIVMLGMVAGTGLGILGTIGFSVSYGAKGAAWALALSQWITMCVVSYSALGRLAKCSEDS